MIHIESIVWQVFDSNLIDPFSLTAVTSPTFRHATWYGVFVSNTDFGLFWDDTAVSHCDTDLKQITEKQFMNYVDPIAKQDSFIVDTTSFFRSISEKREISSPLEHNWPSQSEV